MKKCPNCGGNVAMHPLKKESFREMMDRVIKESSERMKLKYGYGVPDKNKITANDPEDLGSCITGEWKDNNKNMEK